MQKTLENTVTGTFNKSRKTIASYCMKKLNTHVTNQSPDMFTNMRTYRRQHQYLNLNKSKHKFAMHSVHRHFSIAISSSLELEEWRFNNFSIKHVLVVFLRLNNGIVYFTENYIKHQCNVFFGSWINAFQQ